MESYISFLFSISWRLPWVFFLLPMPFFVYFFSPPSRPNDGIYVPVMGGVSRSLKSDLSSTTTSHYVLLTMVWLCFITALAQPMWKSTYKDVPRTGRDIMLAIDASNSMKEKDMLVNGQLTSRYSALKKIMGDFIVQRQGDRIGLILFGDRAYTLSPLSFDHLMIKAMLVDSSIGLAGVKTAIGDAIGLAIKRLRNHQTEKVLILVTDGSNTSGSTRPLNAARMAAQIGMRIYTVGFGSSDASSGFFQHSPIDENTLMNIAQITNGKYFRAKDADELLGFMDEIENLEKMPQDNGDQWIEYPLFSYPLGLSLFFYLLYMFKQIRFRF